MGCFSTCWVFCHVFLRLPLKVVFSDVKWFQDVLGFSLVVLHVFSMGFVV